MPKAVLNPLKKYPMRITGITSMVDNGGSAGQLREDFNVLPSGDIRRHILALSDAPQWKKDLWIFRFGRETFDDRRKGHIFANVFISGLENILKDYGKALKIMHKFMEVKKDCRALPATIDKTQIYAELENGEIVKGENEIDFPIKHDPKLKIKRVYLKPEAKAFLEALEAVEKADLIIIGPGDLYSSLIPCLLMKGMGESFQKSKAKKVFIVNTMTKLGETDDYSVMDFVRQMEKYVGCAFDYVIYNAEIPDKKRIEGYKKEEPSVVEMVKADPLINLGKAGKKFIGAKILTKKGPIVYSPEKLVKLIMESL